MTRPAKDGRTVGPWTPDCYWIDEDDFTVRRRRGGEREDTLSAEKIGTALIDQFAASEEANTTLRADNARLRDALFDVIQWLGANGLSATKDGGVGPFRYKGTEYEFVTTARAALAGDGGSK